MEFIAHRINSIQELNQLDVKYGAEIDLRDWNNTIILQHDPFLPGVEFEAFLKEYRHKTLILNIKSERIEFRILELLHKYEVKNYFFLDSSFPMIYSLTQMGVKDIALRFSEFESIETILAMAGKVEWVWVDCFTKLPINIDSYTTLKNNGFKLCLVSPDLQNQHGKIEIFKHFLESNRIYFDAICTKQYNIERWEND